MVHERPLRLLLAGAFLSCGGCVSGLLYTEISLPLTRNFKGTPVGTKHAELDVKELREPITGANIRVQWDSNAIGDIAKAHGIEKVYSADLRILSVLLGIWKQEHVIVHGD